MTEEPDIVARLRGYVIGCDCDIVARLRGSAISSCDCVKCEAAAEIERLRAERDEARRKICEIESQCICDPPRSPQKYASLFGWDCFKEDTR